MDTDYTSITLFWDWLFGTLQPLIDEEPVEHSITLQSKFRESLNDCMDGNSAGAGPLLGGNSYTTACNGSDSQGSIITPQ